MFNPKLFILGSIAIGSAIAAAVCASWAGYKTAEVIQEKKPETKKEIFKETWKYWVPTGVALTAAIVADIAIVKFGVATMAALTSAITYTTVNRKKIFEKVKSTMNSKEFAEFKKEFSKEKVKEVVKVRDYNVEDTGYGEQVCYLECIDKFFRSDPMEVQKAIKELQWRLKKDDKASFTKFVKDLHITLNDFEEMAYSAFGWFKEDLGDINDTFNDFFIGCEMTEGYIPGLPDSCYVITCWIDPYYIEEYDDREVA